MHLANQADKKANPLTNDELSKFLSELEASGIPEHWKLIGEVVPFSGLSSNEFAHLRQDWITWGEEDEPIEIIIPKKDSCSEIKFKQGGGIVERSEPCRLCRTWAGANHFTTRNDYQNRVVHVQETRAKLALSRWFETYDHNPISYPEVMLINMKKKISFPRNIRWKDLRFTYARILGDHGFEMHHIAKWLGYNPTNSFSDHSYNLTAALRQSRTQYSKHMTLKDYFQVIQEHGPLTKREIADLSGRKYHPARRRVNRLHELGWIEKVGIDESVNVSTPPVLWDCVEGCEPHLVCDTCGKKFDTDTGLSMHTSMMHE